MKPGIRSALTIAQMIESDEPGGAELVVVRLAEELRRRGHTVIPVGPAKGVGWLGEQLRQVGFEPRTFTLKHIKRSAQVANRLLPGRRRSRSPTCGLSDGRGRPARPAPAA